MVSVLWKKLRNGSNLSEIVVDRVWRFKEEICWRVEYLKRFLCLWNVKVKWRDVLSFWGG